MFSARPPALAKSGGLFDPELKQHTLQNEELDLERSHRLAPGQEAAKVITELLRVRELLRRSEESALALAQRCGELEEHIERLDDHRRDELRAFADAHRSMERRQAARTSSFVTQISALQQRLDEQREDESAVTADEGSVFDVAAEQQAEQQASDEAEAERRRIVDEFHRSRITDEIRREFEAKMWILERTCESRVAEAKSDASNKVASNEDELAKLKSRVSKLMEAVAAAKIGRSVVEWRLPKQMHEEVGKAREQHEQELAKVRLERDS